MTHDQMALLEMHELVLPQHEPGQTIDQRFEAFHRLNPWIFQALVALTGEYVAAGAGRVSVKMLVEVVRYRYGVTRGFEPYRINNSFTALYARRLVQEHPEWDGLFELRQRRTERAA